MNVIGMPKMTPPIKDLLPRLTPVLKNRHEKVQENCIDLVGRIADRGAEFVPAREWMRICFELLEMLKAHKKGIRRAPCLPASFVRSPRSCETYLDPAKYGTSLILGGRPSARACIIRRFCCQASPGCHHNAIPGQARGSANKALGMHVAYVEGLDTGTVVEGADVHSRLWNPSPH